MNRHAHARRLVDALDDHVRDAVLRDPHGAAGTHFGLTVEPSHSFGERGAGGWCDGASITTAGIVLYRPTASRRENFTIAHELAHHLVADDDDCPSWLADQDTPKKLEEEICDSIAARLLISDEVVTSVLGGARPSAQTVADLYQQTAASRTACSIAVANRLPCDGFVALTVPGSGIVFAGARARDTRPYAWKDNPIPPAHPLHRPNPPAKAKSWWSSWDGERHTFYMSTAEVSGYVIAVFAESDLWQVEKLHFDAPAEPDRGNDATIKCPCGYTGKTRMWPCSNCGVPECPKCGECECPRRARREATGRCTRCTRTVRAHLLVHGLCDDCR